MKQNLTVALSQDALCLEIRKTSLLFDRFLFFDTADCLAQPLFLRHGAHVRFEDAYASNDFPFLAVFCRVRKADREKFMAAINDLKRKMILCGYPRYEAEIREMLEGASQ